MAPPKSNIQWGVLADNEATYGGGATLLAGTHGKLVIEDPTPEKTYLHDGARGPAAAAAGVLPRSGQTGLEFTAPLVMEAAGGGAAYDDSTVWPNIHEIMLAAGFASVVDTTPSSESVTYTPESSGFDSLAAEIYVRGQMWDLNGGYLNLAISVDGPGQPRWEFELRARGAVETDVVLPAITSYSVVVPPKATNVGLSIDPGTPWTGAVLRGFAINLNRELASRADDNSAGGHAGFAPGRRVPTLELTIEAVPLATFNPYTAFDVATPLDISFTIGSVQYDRYTFNAPQANITGLTEDEDGPTALWVIEAELPITGVAADDDLSFVFN